MGTSVICDMKKKNFKDNLVSYKRHTPSYSFVSCHQT